MIDNIAESSIFGTIPVAECEACEGTGVMCNQWNEESTCGDCNGEGEIEIDPSRGAA